jgi:hypothetical protein
MLGAVAVLAFVAVRAKKRETTIILAFGVAILGIASTLLTTVVVADIPPESHRFMTLPEVVLPLLVLAMMREASPLGRYGAALVLTVPAIWTLIWTIGIQPLLVSDFREGNFAVGIDGVDCRAATGARLFERATPTYIPERAWYLWTGCHPTLAPAQSGGEGTRVDVSRPIYGKAALAALAGRFVAQGREVRLACPIDDRHDPVCMYARARSACGPSGDSWEVCTLKPEAIAPLLATLPD